MNSNSKLRKRDSSDVLADVLKLKSRDAKSNPDEVGVDGRELLVLVVDTSASMSSSVDASTQQSKLDVLRDAIRMLANIAEVHQSHLMRLECVEFNDMGYVVSPWLAANYATGGTNLADGLMVALGLVASRVGYHNARIALMTDGMATSTGEAVAEAIAIAKQNSVVVDTVAFGGDADRGLLRRIAAATGGIYLEAASAGDLIHCFARLDTRTRGLLESGSTVVGRRT